MREYSKKIALLENSRGIYSLDTVMGCSSGMINEKNGCYNECYSAKSAKLYGYDFAKNVLRDFENEYHRREIMNQINTSKLDFIRIGSNGDPSENWEHTVSILKKIDKCNKHIVIITKHWNNLNIDQLNYLATINVCINTSVSALDKIEILENSLEQYNILKKYCKSVLRIVSCDFNILSEKGKYLFELQEILFKNESVIDTVFRVSKSNKLVKEGVINVTSSKFLGKKALISKFNKKTYFGKCSKCLEMCGLNLNPQIKEYPEKRNLHKQLKMFE